MSRLLDIQGLTVSYGGVVAVDDVSFAIERGTFVGLIGPNGAGKTTFIDAVTGFTPSRGRLDFEGQELNRMPAHRRARKGVSRTFQSLELFEDLTVRENLMVSADPPRWWGPIVNAVLPRATEAPLERIEKALDFMGISEVAERFPNDLSLGQRKLVTVARALVGKPALLLLDEPAAGLDSGETQELGTLLRRIVDSGVTVLLVDHDMGLVLSVCDAIHVLEFGKLIASGAPASIRADERVIHAYLGSAAAEAVESGADA